MPRSRKSIVTTHDADFHNLIPLLTTNLAKIPGVRGGEVAGAFAVWDYLGMPLKDLCGKEFGMSRQDVAHNDAILQAKNPRLLRGLRLTQELKQHLKIPPDIGLDPIEQPISWRSVMFFLPQPMPDIPHRRKGKSAPLEKQAMREVLDRYRATLHHKLDDECNGLYALVNASPEQANPIVQELLRLGY